ncbi:MAG: transposase [Desertimonas sp.]
MARPPSRSAEDKVRLVLAVLRGELTIAAAARREGVSQTSIANWRDQFLDGGQQAVAAGGPSKPTSREHQLTAENEQLAAAFGRSAHGASPVA